MFPFSSLWGLLLGRYSCENRKTEQFIVFPYDPCMVVPEYSKALLESLRPLYEAVDGSLGRDAKPETRRVAISAGSDRRGAAGNCCEKLKGSGIGFRSLVCFRRLLALPKKVSHDLCFVSALALNPTL